jgi:hypothetical protein
VTRRRIWVICRLCGHNGRPVDPPDGLCGDCRKALLRKHGCTDADIALTGGEWVPVGGIQRWRPKVTR